MSSLWKLKNEYQFLMQIALDDDTDPQAIEDTIDGLEGEIGEKLDSSTYIVNEIDGKIESISAEIKRLEKYKDSLCHNKESIVRKMECLVDALPDKKMDTQFHKYYFKKNPAHVEIDNEALIPMEYWIPQDPKVDKKAISTYLKSLKEDEKCEYAHLESGRSFKY